MSDTFIDAVERKLRAGLAPDVLRIIDDSEKHRGHRGASGGRHLTLEIVSARFAGLGAMARHRLIYGLLQDEMKGGAIHALAITAKAPGE